MQVESSAESGLPEMLVARHGHSHNTAGQIGVVPCPIRTWSSVTFSYPPGIANVVASGKKGWL
jgi:hypothetical protein